MTEPIPLQPRTNCPDCGSSLRRVSRQEGDEAEPGKRRYACVRRSCGWDGLLPQMLPRSMTPPTDRSRLPRQRSLTRAFLIGLATVAAATFLVLTVERMMSAENRANATERPKTP